MEVVLGRLPVLALASLTVLVASNEFAAAQKDAARRFTLEQVLSAPFPSDLVAAPVKGRFAWVYNAQGKRNVWIAEPAEDGRTYSSHAITGYPADDGQDIGEISWAPDGDALVCTRGGDLEFSEKPSPNPASIPGGVEQAVWLVALHGGDPKKLGEGHSPAFSPKGDVVAYVLKGQIWLAKLPGADKPEQLLHTRGSSESLRWSPDGNLRAFVSARGEYSFIGVYSIAAKTLTYVDPGTDHDVEPVWSPDSTKLAFLRIPSSGEDLIFEPKRVGSPWSIRVRDLATGKSTEVWRASEGAGSVFREVVSDRQLLWGSGDRLVFPREQDGWTHLYSVPIHAGKTELLTLGRSEVEYVSLSPDRTTVFYSSNQGDIDRRHIWKVAVTGGQPAALTKGTGIETAPVASSDARTVALLRSDASLPMRPALLMNSGEPHDLAPEAMPADFPSAQLVIPQPVIFQAADGMPIHAQLFLPPASTAGPHAAAIPLHVGSRRQMLLGWHYMEYYSNAYAMNQYLAVRGYVVLAVNYRSGIGYGMEFREALNYGAAGASEFNDVEGAGLYLGTRSDVDPKRIALWGGSYGGYLTALGLARASDLFAAGVDFHGLHDWNQELRNWLPAYDPQRKPEGARLAWESSPLASVKTWRSPVLLIHGDDDRNVPFSETVALTEALRKQGVEFEQRIFPDEIHDFLLHSTWLSSYSATAGFLDRHVGRTANVSPAH
jgi:dipeptidyl aminopeptidase/acylaminoacyl peptidase